MPLEVIPYLLRLTHAMCYYTIQGRTLRDRKILLIDTDHPNFSRRALIAGLSRATHGEVAHVADNEAAILDREWRIKEIYGECTAEIYGEVGFPSASKFRTALHKQGQQRLFGQPQGTL